MQFSLVTAGLALAALADTVSGESHIIQFNNRCGFGTPTLIQGSTVLSTGANFTSSGPLITAIAYLQTGSCGFNGEGCTLIETTLMNPVEPPGVGSGSDINLIPPHAFSVASGFAYVSIPWNGGSGTTLSDSAHSANDSFLQVQCQEDNVNLLITFCDES